MKKISILMILICFSCSKPLEVKDKKDKKEEVIETQKISELKRKCDEKDGVSCYFLAYSYAYGEGVEKNEQISQKYLKSSCKAGIIRGCKGILPSKEKDSNPFLYGYFGLGASNINQEYGVSLGGGIFHLWSFGSIYGLLTFFPDKKWFISNIELRWMIVGTGLSYQYFDQSDVMTYGYIGLPLPITWLGFEIFDTRYIPIISIYWRHYFDENSFNQFGVMLELFD